MLYEERLDSARIQFNGNEAFWAEYLRAKYASVELDLILTESGPAAAFLDRNADLFPGAKRYFIDPEEVISNAAGEQLAANEDFILQMRVIFEVRPATKNLIVIGNFYPKRVEQSHAVWLENFKDRVNFEAWTDDFSFPELYDRVSGLADDTVILYQLVNHDRMGNLATPFEVLHNLSKASSVPVFVTHDTLMGSGAVGGYLLSAERVGAMIADLLGGADLNAYANSPFSFNQFDDRALQRWGIRHENLPADSEILFTRPTFWDQNKHLLSVVTLEAFLVLILFWALMSRRRAFAELQMLATTDSLTGTLNRREFLSQLEKEWGRVQRHESIQSTVLMIDIDFFKKINDSLGHKAGDTALIKLGDILRNTVRKIDVVARIGGEEFAFILIGAGEHQAFQFAERLRKKIESTSITFDGQSFKMTVSIGVSVILPTDSDSAIALSRADKALYVAKGQGRNCTKRA